MTQDTQRQLKFFFRNIATFVGFMIGGAAYAILISALPQIWAVLLIVVTLATGIGYFAWDDASYKLMRAKMEEERTARHLAREPESF
jgi:hypothetical protein